VVAVREQAFLVVVFFWQKARSVPTSKGMDANLPSLDQLRNNAAECIRLAEAARTSEHKSFFIEMAERWLTLAERAEKTQAR
jgi:anaerobic glycerol-3-phosphate dehydrogenase